jgi:hypothetical protein
MLGNQKEVVVRLSSGLGNQLFQLAQGMSLAEQLNARLSYDTTWFCLVSWLHPVKREIRLQEFGVPLPEAFKGLRRLAVGALAAFYDKTRKSESLLSALGSMRVIQEDPLYQSHEQKLGNVSTGRIYLNGYWQTKGSFGRTRDKLLPLLQPRRPLSRDAEAFIARAKSKNTGFIHVRRSDYIHFMGENGLLPVSYYSRALAKLQEGGTRIDHWMIFSEDADWSITNLGFVPNAEIVDYQSTNRDIEDLMIMRACSAGIVANSSYSWWGAALGDRRDRPIIVPDRYWKNSDWSATHWALPEWYQVNAWSD